MDIWNFTLPLKAWVAVKEEIVVPLTIPLSLTAALHSSGFLSWGHSMRHTQAVFLPVAQVYIKVKKWKT